MSYISIHQQPYILKRNKQTKLTHNIIKSNKILILWDNFNQDERSIHWKIKYFNEQKEDTQKMERFFSNIRKINDFMLNKYLR